MKRPELEWDRRAQRIEFDALEAARRWAGQWRAGISTLSGAVGLAILTKNASDVRALDVGPRVTIFLLISVGFAMLAVSAWLALTATSGYPTEILNGGQALRQWTRDETARTRRRMAESRVLAVTGLTLAVGSIAVSWLFPAQAARDDSKLVIVLKDGSVICAERASPQAGALLVVADGEVTTVRLADVTTVDVAACPSD